MTLDLIAELLPYPSRSFMVAYEYDYRQEWMEKLWRIIVRSGPSVVSAHECNTNIPADSVASPLSTSGTSCIASFILVFPTCAASLLRLGSVDIVMESGALQILLLTIF